MNRTLNSLVAAVLASALQWAPSQVMAQDAMALEITRAQGPLIHAIADHDISRHVQFLGGDYGV